MCGRFGLTRPDRLRLERLGVDVPDGIVPRYNIAPGGDVLVLREHGGQRELVPLHWGLLPRWAHSAGDERMVNVRVEGGFHRGAFRDALHLHRCLVPADVFYEWQQVRGRRRKQPWAIGLPDGTPFAFGAIWERWSPRGAEAVESVAILTTAANAVVAPLHDRMPVIIEPAHYADWLDARTPEPGVLEMAMPWPSEATRAWPIGERVNRTGEDDAALLDAVEPPGPGPELELDLF